MGDSYREALKAKKKVSGYPSADNRAKTARRAAIRKLHYGKPPSRYHKANTRQVRML